MPDIEPQVQPEYGHLNRIAWLWETITESDVPLGKYVEGGKYSVTAQGTFGGGTVELLYSRDGVTYHSIDTTNLTFSEDKTYNLEIARGYLKPDPDGGSSMDVDFYVSPIPSDPA